MSLENEQGRTPLESSQATLQGFDEMWNTFGLTQRPPLKMM